MNEVIAKRLGITGIQPEIWSALVQSCDAAAMIASLVVGSMNRIRSEGCDNAGIAMFLMTEELSRSTPRG